MRTDPRYVRFIGARQQARTVKLATAAVIVSLTSLIGARFASAQQPVGQVTDDERQTIRERLESLDSRLRAIEGRNRFSADRTAEAGVYLKAVLQTVDYEPVIDAKGRILLETALQHGEERTRQLETGRHPWTETPGRSLRGFVSAVDGSTQPYFLIVPPTYDAAKPMRLDVVLHGSVPRRSAIGGVDFVLGGPRGGGDWLELHPMGRLGENAYRFEGETDVFEAIETVGRQFNVDRRRIVLRGSSLGAVGTWEIGLRRPDRFVALGPAAGPVDTLLFAAAPWPHFVKLAPLTPWQKKTLHMVDAIDYTANAGMIPVVAAMGDNDPYFPSHLQAERAFAAEGIPFTGIVAKGAGHGLDGPTLQEQLRLLGEREAAGIPARPSHIRFVTWTLKYSRCHWIEVLGLDAHYQRSEIEVTLADDGSVAVAKLSNITRFAIHPPALEGPAANVLIVGQLVPLPPGARDGRRPLVFAHRDGEWRCLGELDAVALTGKRPGLQGPIDDAFAAPFLCVRGTGTPVNDAVGRWADVNLQRFAWEWGFHYRGTLPVKDDTEVTANDLRDKNLVLFGDPGSNRWIRDALPKLAVKWSPDAVTIGDTTYPAVDHGLALIAPNPLPGAAGRYVVFNSGHTYHDPELRLSYMVFPRLGDWAVIKVGDNAAKSAPSADVSGVVKMPTVAETVITSGFFDEDWSLP